MCFSCKIVFLSNTYLMEKWSFDPLKSSSIGFVVSSYCNYYSSISYPCVVNAGLFVSRIGKSSVDYRVRKRVFEFYSWMDLFMCLLIGRVIVPNLSMICFALNYLRYRISFDCVIFRCLVPTKFESMLVKVTHGFYLKSY